MENLANISSARYDRSFITGDNSGITATINGVQMSVPLDPDNWHYAEILRQVEAGTLVIQEAE